MNLRSNYLMGACTLATAAFSTTSTMAADKKMNFLFIAVDDFKPNINCYGVKNAITPNMDSLAKKGSIFFNNQCNYPVCGPSRASIMSGFMPEVTGVIGFKKMRRFLPDLVTLPQYLITQGYETAATGKINDPRCVEGGQLTDDPRSWSLPYVRIKYNLIYHGAKPKQALEFPDMPDNKFVDDQIAEHGLGLLRKLAKGDKPFFLGVGFKKPHLPFLAPKKYWDMYKSSDFKTASFQEKVKDGGKHIWHNSQELRGYGGVPKKGEIPKQLQIDLIHGYYACITFIDTQVGRLLKELKTLGLEDNTTVILWGDHGWHLGDHGIWGKHTNLEQASRAPLIIYSPKFKKHRAIKTPTQFLDLYPTVVDMANAPIPDFVQGKSLVPLISGKTDRIHDGVITLFNRNGYGYSYRTDRYRYIEVVDPRKKKVNERELFDYEKDPLEKVNLANNPEYAELVKKLSADLHKAGVGCKVLKKVEKK